MGPGSSESPPSAPASATAPRASTSPTRTVPNRSGSWCGIPIRYEIQSIIGRGTYGTVCEAYDRGRRELVAVKQVRRLFENLPSCKRTLREIAILTALDHDCVIKIHDIFVPRDEVESFSELYIVMELCDTDLRNLISLDMVLSTEHIKWLMFNLMRGLAYLHSVGVCHRDLKPANCLVNQHCTVKITDFNLSCIIGDDPQRGPTRPPSPIESSGPQRRSTTNRAHRELTSHVVTRHYRAPEVILLERKYTHKIDIWSAACIFAELLQTLPDGPHCSERGPLFPGTCSYPLSPGPATRRQGHGRDQLSLIFDFLGTPTEEQIAGLDRADARRYVQRFQARTGYGVQARMPYAGEEEVELVSQMLAFSPEDRISAQQALENPFFASVQPEDEAEAVSALQMVHLDFEENGQEDSLREEPGLRNCIVEVMRRLSEKEGASTSPANDSADGRSPGEVHSDKDESGCTCEEEHVPSKGDSDAPAARARLMAAAHEAASAFGSP